MPFEYVNRRDERYYLLQGTTKTGKPKYYVSRKPNGVRVDKVPEGYEIHEDPERGLVSIRKVRTSQVTSTERDLLARWTQQFAGIEYFYVDVQGDSLVIYTPSTDPTAAANMGSEIFGPFLGGLAAAREWTGKRATYLPMLRFTFRDAPSKGFPRRRNWCMGSSWPRPCLPRCFARLGSFPESM